MPSWPPYRDGFGSGPATSRRGTMIRLLYFSLLVYLAVTLWKLISRQLQASRQDETPASESVIDVEAKDAD
ncbi:Hypothetical protein SynRCC307_1537 [Synechococcus sp. RCC307]|nr:Hypothetical protein SynRCC307_1537 [Synechococcus sp. RCC307]